MDNNGLHGLTLGSLFDGIGGFPFAAELSGVKPLWAAEVNPFCVALTRQLFPDMVHYGNVAKLSGADLPPVDIISFGSPCQDVSVAGKRKGIKHTESGDEETTRSGMFFEAIRIIYEMREATNGRYPTFIIWENVAGAFTSNSGGDFRKVLEEITKTDIPMPTSGKWAHAGMVRGGQFVSAGDCSTVNIGECPSEESESILSEVLEAIVPRKYYLSATACEGILRRAENRGKKLEADLEAALKMVVRRAKIEK